MVIGVSGGLDSTHALIVCCRTADQLGAAAAECAGLHHARLCHQRSNRKQCMETHEIAWASAPPKSTSARPACRCSRTSAIPSPRGEPLHDITFENVQAGERTSHLFRLANLHGGIVIGTGDLSELALGWCTYGVGDQMSHYNVNASIPKTLIQHLIRWEIERGKLPEETRSVLRDILATDISPELIPAGPDAPQRPPAE